MRTITTVTPIQLPDGDFPTLVGDRILEGGMEGITRMNVEYMAAGILPDIHPYSDFWGMVYERDPIDIGSVNLDGKKVPVQEYWATAVGAADRGHDDCDTLTPWLCAWYRHVCKINACPAIYPSIRGPNGIVGRHVVAWVPLAAPLYLDAPWDSSKFIRHVIPDVGYIEDPSAALGMWYTGQEPRLRLPTRQSFTLSNHAALVAAKKLRVPFHPSHSVFPS